MDKQNYTSENIVGIYRDISTPERIINTSVGRTEMVQDFLEMLIRRVNSSHHTLFIGPRGIGKTHLLTLIVQGVQNSSELSRRYTVIRFPEENNRILSFADFLLGVIEILANVIDDSEWRKLYIALHTEENDKIIIDTILPKISAWHKKTKNNLLIMIENLNVLLTQQIKNKQSIHYLRSFLMDDPAAVFIGTAPLFFAELNDINHPLYDFFEIQIISELDENQTLELIKKNLEYDHCTEQLDNFESLVPKIKALHIMTGGNPRLIMLLYGLIAHERITDVKLQFQKLLDSISPFYQDRLKDLPPQEKALLENMALMRSRQEPRTPGNIAKKMRKPAKQISSLLKRMLKTGYLLLETDAKDRRRKIYRIKEGFFDLWLAMSLSRVHRNRFPYLAEFFANWYISQQE